LEEPIAPGTDHPAARSIIPAGDNKCRTIEGIEDVRAKLDRQLTVDRKGLEHGDIGSVVTDTVDLVVVIP